MTASGVAEKLEALSQRGAWWSGRKRADGDLYRLLVECARVCSEHSEAEVREAFLLKFPQGRDSEGRRRYLERRSDIYAMVARVVFEGTGGSGGRGGGVIGARRDVAWRYGAALRSAAEKQVSWSELESVLEKGGVSGVLGRGASRDAQLRGFGHVYGEDGVDAGADDDGWVVVRVRRKIGGAGWEWRA